MAGGSGRLEVDVGIIADTDELSLGQLADQLRAVGVDRAWIPEVGAPAPGGRGGDLGVAGTLLLTLAGSTDLLRSVVETVRSWLGGAGARSARLTIGKDTIEVSGLSPRAQERLIEAWIRRHAA